MKDLGIIEEREDIFRLCHNMVSHGLLSEMADDKAMVERAVGHHAVFFGYSNYGGDIFDKLCCRAVMRRDAFRDFAIHETTSYDGEQMVVFGTLADNIADAGNDPYLVADALGMDLDEDMTRLEYEYVSKAVEHVSGELKADGVELDDEDVEFMYEWLEANGKPAANDWDFDSAALEKAIRERKGVSESAKGAAPSAAVVAKLVYDKGESMYYLLTSLGDEIALGSPDGARDYCDRHGMALVSPKAEIVDESSSAYPTAAEYSMVSSRESARSILENVGRLREALGAMEGIDAEKKAECENLLWLVEQDARLIVKHGESLRDSLDGAESAYAQDMELVRKANAQSAG